MSKFFPIRLIPENTKINFMGMKKQIFSFLLILVMASFVLVFTRGINFGIDFTGGTLIEAKLESKPDVIALYALADKLEIPDIKIQDFDGNNLMIRIGNHAFKNGNLNNKDKVSILKDELSKFFDNKIEFRKTDYVGPQIGSELIKQCFIAVILSFIAIMTYVALRFEWQFSVGILIALLHDAILTIGFMSIAQVEFDLTSIAAILTVIGYSVNDSVVIYDRIRENLRKYHRLNLDKIINLSLNETLSRTVLTVATTIIAVIALIFFGGPALYSFSITVFVGIIIGTFSSIYISAPVLIYIGLKSEQIPK